MRASILAVYWLALTAWIAAIAAAAVSAMSVFSTMPDMAMAYDRFASFPASEHGRVAAGVVMDRIFSTVDGMQLVAAPLAVIALVAQLLWPDQCLRRPVNAMRTVCIVTAAAILGYYLLALSPRLTSDLHAFWAAAEIGDLDAAEAARAAFGARHGLAERVLQVNLLLLLAAVAASAIALGPSATASASTSPPVSGSEPQ